MNTSPGQVAVVDAQVAVGDEQTKKYLTLLELSKAIASHRDLSGLFHDLACRLQSLVDFSHLGVLLYDPKQNVMRLHMLETCQPAEWQAAAEVPMEGSIAGWVWEHQEAVVIRDLETDDRFPYAKILLERPVKSICSVPLTTAHQRLGVVNFWTDKTGAYDLLDIEFVKLVAAQIAVAVEAQCYQHKLARERDRSQLLLEINNTLVSNLNLTELLAAISKCLRRVMPHDAAGLALYDSGINKLRVTALDFPAGENVFIADEIIELEDTPGGRAFTTRQPVIIRSDEPPVALAKRAGLKSGCVVPLISHDRALGTLGLGSLQENAFTEDDADLLNQVGKQVAIAVENALAFRQIDELKNQLTEEKLYLEEEIRTEYNFEEIIGNSPVLKRVLQDVETVAATDSTVLIYGETGTGKELIAHAIHNLSPRRERTLVKVNCAAIPTGLLESEFFGHERGAFTGAIDRRDQHRSRGAGCGKEVSQRSLLSSQRFPDHRAAVARASGRHPAARSLLRKSFCTADEEANRERAEGDDGRVDRLRLARQHTRAAESRRTRRDPLAWINARDSVDRVETSSSFYQSDQQFNHARICRTRSYSSCAQRDTLGHRRSRWGRGASRHESHHTQSPHAETRHQPSSTAVVTITRHLATCCHNSCTATFNSTF